MSDIKEDNNSNEVSWITLEYLAIINKFYTQVFGDDKKNAINTQPAVNPREVSDAQKDLEAAQEKLNLQALPIRAYLDQTVVPILLDGMSALVSYSLNLYS